MSKLKVAVLVSGSGSNLQALIDAQARGALDVEIVKVISSRPDAYALKRAAQAGIATLSLNKDIYLQPGLADEILATELKACEAELVILAGYMRKIEAGVLHFFAGKIINLHPALLPAFKGAHAIKDAYEAGVRITGITMHFVDAGYDTGPIIAQRALNIRPQESLESLEARIHSLEHELIVEVTQLFAKHKISLGPDGRVILR